MMLMLYYYLEINSPNDVYLIKWMDFSSKYGIGYLLSNGTSGFYYNDGTSLILSTDKNKGHYFQPGEDNKKVLVRESFLASDPNAVIRQKLDIMQKFNGFLQSSSSANNMHESNDLFFLVKFFRTSQATFFRLSHRILQVNFFDHCKLIFSEDGRLITFLDQEKRCLIFPCSISRIHLPSAITCKLQYVADIFYGMVKTIASGVPNSSLSSSSRLGKVVCSSTSMK
jgi:polo-like kinase 1